MINKVIFEEEWKVIRSQSTAWWSLMAEYDLVKVDKAEVKFDKYMTLLQVKYGYTREKAREELGRRLAEYQSTNKNATAATSVAGNKRSNLNERSTRKAKTQARIQKQTQAHSADETGRP